MGLRRASHIAFIAGFLACGALTDAASTPEVPANEYEVKAAFLYNFAKFIEWPAESFKSENDPLVIGVLGKDPFGSQIDGLIQGHTIHNHPVIVRRLSDADSALGCHVLFVADSERKRLASILKSLDDHPIVTISDMSDFVPQGGMIGLDMQDNRVRFSINKTASDERRLNISSQILKLATDVK